MIKVKFLNLIIFCILICVSFALSVFIEGSITYLLISVNILVASLPFILTVSVKKKNFDMFEPVYLFVFLYTIYHAIRSLYLLHGTSVSTSPYMPSNLTYYIDLALLYGLIGLVSFLIGYYVRLNKLLRPIFKLLRSLPTRKIGVHIIYILFGISIIYIFYIFYIRQSPLSFVRVEFSHKMYAWPLELIRRFSLYSLSLALLIIWSNYRPYGVHFLKKFTKFIIIPTCIFYAIWTGAKVEIFILVWVIIVAYYYSGHKINKKQVLFISLILLLSFPFMGQWRAIWINHIGYTTHFSLIDLVYVLLNSVLLLFSSLVKDIMAVFTIIFNRLAGIDQLILVLASDEPPIYGKTIFLAPILALVPRAIWPSKPVIGSSADMFRQVYWGGSTIDPNWAGAISVTKLVDLYLNFGLIGIIIGMFFLGLLMKSCYIYLIKNKRSIFSIFSYTFIVYTLIDIDHGLGISLVEFIRLIFIFWVIKRILIK